jgi:hypothetical protein
MNKHLLDYNLKVRLPVIAFVVLAVFAITYYASYAERNSIGYTPDQPIKFSHKLHAGSMQIDCKYCHSGVDKSRSASIPSVDVCMNCHSQARKDRPDIIKLTEHYEKNIPLEWKRIHKVPQFVYFNHSSHVNKKIDCIDCHGDVKQMEVVGQTNSFTMGACLTCHRKPETKISNYEQIKNDIKKGPEYCAACHR